jgi:hypothetical protein
MLWGTTIGDQACMVLFVRSRPWRMTVVLSCVSLRWQTSDAGNGRAAPVVVDIVRDPGVVGNCSVEHRAGAIVRGAGNDGWQNGLAWLMASDCIRSQARKLLEEACAQVAAQRGLDPAQYTAQSLRGMEARLDTFQLPVLIGRFLGTGDERHLDAVLHGFDGSDMNAAEIKAIAALVRTPVLRLQFSC